MLKQSQTPDHEAQAARRAFLKKAGKFAAYTPPALMVLMHPSRHAIAQSGGSHNSGGGTRPVVDGPGKSQAGEASGASAGLEAKCRDLVTALHRAIRQLFS